VGRPTTDAASPGQGDLRLVTLREKWYAWRMIELRGEALGRRMDLALARVGAFFMGDSPVQKAAAEIARRLAEARVDYAIAGALGVATYGFVRATEDVDLLITREGLDRFKSEWLGRGYVNVRPGGKAVRDTVHDVKIDFLVTGDFPGDGRPKPVAFPHPAEAGVEAGQYRVISLARLIELKLASGMTAPHRLQDLADVQRLIAVARIPRDFSAELDPYVRSKFDELWVTAQHPEEEY
jgi:hypothetical protein